MNNNKMCTGGIIVDYLSDFHIYNRRTTTVNMSWIYDQIYDIRSRTFDMFHE